MALNDLEKRKVALHSRVGQRQYGLVLRGGGGFTADRKSRFKPRFYYLLAV